MKLKTLIIDDQPEAIKLLGAMLADHCEITFTTSGVDGIERFKKEMMAGSPFDIVLLDVIMPEISGVEVLKRMREFEALHHHDIQLYVNGGTWSRIIMQTASENLHDFFSSYLQGKCHGYITKPYSKEEILQKVLG